MAEPVTPVDIIVHADAFGSAVVALLVPHGFQPMPLERALAASWDRVDARYVGIVQGSARPSALTSLTERLWDAGHPHGAVFLSEQFLTCGPLVLPPQAPCVTCMTKRMLSLIELPRTAKLEMRFQQYQERSADHELSGHLPTLAMMAALRIRMHATLDRALCGVMTAISFISNRTVESPILPLHACRCRGSTQAAGSDRWVAAIEARVEELLSL